MKKTLKLWTLIIATALFTTAAWADNLDPATLHFGPGFGTTCYAGCAGDPNKVLGSGFDIYQESGGQSLTLTQSNPLLLIVSVPNGQPAVAAASIGTVTFYPNATSSTGSFTGTGVAAASLSTTYEVSPNTYSFSNPGFNSGQVYTFLHLTPATDSSNSFTNYTLAGNDPTATSFTVYVFDIYGPANTTLPGNGLIQVNFNTPLPLGSMLAGYTTTGGKNYDNAFTEAGFVSNTAQVPEPSSMLLFGTGLSGVAFFLRRRSQVVKS